MLSDGNHREIADVQIDSNRHQIRISFALDHLFGFDGFRLGKMQLSRLFAQHEFGALLLPRAFLESLLEVARGLGRVVVPLPALPGIYLQVDKTIFSIERFQIEGEGALIERGMIAGSRRPWFA